MLVIDDGHGRRLHLAWSESHLVVSVIGPGLAQVTLDPDQVETLRLFVADVRGALVLGGLTFRWHPGANRMLVRADACAVELHPYDLGELAAFLAR